MNRKRLLAVLAALGAVACIPDVPVLGGACNGDNDCDDAEVVSHCQLNQSPNVCIPGPPPNDRPPVLLSGLIVATRGQTVEGQLSVFDPEGATTRFLPDRTVGPLGVLTVEADGRYLFEAGDVENREDTYRVTFSDNRATVSAEVFVFVSAAPSGELVEWRGGVSSAFTEPLNWNPTATPSRNTGALITAGTPRDATVDDTANARELLVGSGARLVLGTLFVHGDRMLIAGEVDALPGEDAVIQLERAADLGGNVPTLSVRSGGTLVAPLRVTGNLQLAGAALPLNLGPQSAVVQGNLDQIEGAGGLNMSDSTANLDVGGRITLGGGGASSFGAGRLVARGDLRARGNGFRPLSGFVLELAGEGTQNVRVEDDSYLGQTEVGVNATARFETDLIVNGDLDIAGTLDVAAGSTVGVVGTLLLRRTFAAARDVGGAVRATTCEAEEGVELADFPFIECDVVVDPIGDDLPPPPADKPIVIEQFVAVNPIINFGAPAALRLVARGADRCVVDHQVFVDENDDETIDEVVDLPRPGDGLYRVRCENASFEAEAVTPLQVVCGIIETLELGVTFIQNQADLDNFPRPPDGCFALDNSLIIADAFEVEDLRGLYGLRSINGRLLVLRNQDLVSLDGLQMLAALDFGLALGDSQTADTGNPRLADIDDLRALRSLGDVLEIAGNPLLGDLFGLRSIDQSGFVPGRPTALANGLRLAGNDGLTSLRGLEGLRKLTGPLSIVENPALGTLDALALQETAGINLVGNEILSDISALSTVTSVSPVGFDCITPQPGLEFFPDPTCGAIRIIDNPTLASAAALNGLEAATSEELVDVTITDNASLAEVPALTGIVAMSGALDISRNDVAGSIGLVSLASIDSEQVTIVDNGCMPAFEVNALLARAGLEPDGVDRVVDDNLGPCE